MYVWLTFQCEQCQPLYNDKPFRQGDQLFPYNCKLCQCNNHADSCVYQEEHDPNPNDHISGGGGVCVDCRDNTAGKMCETCIDGFYEVASVPKTDPNACQPCLCNDAGVKDPIALCMKVSSNVSLKYVEVCPLGEHIFTISCKKMYLLLFT